MTRKEFLIGAILTFVIIIAWVIFDLIHANAKVETSRKVQQLIEPINPNFDLRPLQDERLTE